MENIEKALDEKFEQDMKRQLKKHYDLTLFPKLTRQQIRIMLGDLRFDMSGYDSEPGYCTIHNLEVLNTFAKFGIYDYTEYLVVDFHKGNPRIFLCYWGEDLNYIIDDLYGLTTSEIISKVLEFTVYSGKKRRRRN